MDHDEEKLALIQKTLKEGAVAIRRKYGVYPSIYYQRKKSRYEALG